MLPAALIVTVIVGIVVVANVIHRNRRRKPASMEGRQAMRAEVAEQVGNMIREGFRSPDEIAQLATEMVSDDSNILIDEIDAEVKLAVKEGMRSHLAEQAKWPETTDCDRLDRAFEFLEAQGIVARQNFTCCQT